MFKKVSILILILSMLLLLFTGCSPASTTTTTSAKITEIILATTTSTQDSGLLDYLIPMFEAQTGYKVKTIAVGTGQALELGNRGEADVLLTHAAAKEQPLVDSGAVINYQLVMHNDFIIVGPSVDPAGVKKITTAPEAFKSIADNKAIFISRGDDSGTYTKEMGIWKTAGIEAPSGVWYQESGQGMGATLKIANEKQGYTLSDRATYLSQKASLELIILNEGSKDLLNIYHVMQVNAEKFSKVNAAGAKAFVDFMINPDIQKKIGEFGKDKYGEALFFPDAK